MAAGKWILGGLGFVLGGPIGALIGVFIGSLFDSAGNVLTDGNDDTSSNTDRQYTDSQSNNSNGRYERQAYERAYRRATVGDIRVSMVVLFACVIKADGRVMKSEVNYIKPFLLKNYGEEGAKEALHLLKELLQKNIDPIAVSQQIARNINYSTRLEIVHILFDLAQCDGEVSAEEEAMISLIATNMRIANADYQSLLALYRRHADPNWAYTALEIEPSASDEEVKKAYRRMAMKYHPDKVANAGEEVRQQATEKFRSINEAYEVIKTGRGIK